MKTKEGLTKRRTQDTAKGALRPFIIAVFLLCGVLCWTFLSFGWVPVLAEEPNESQGMDFIFVDMPAEMPSEEMLPAAAVLSAPVRTASDAGWTYDNGALRIEITEHKERFALYYTVELWLTDITQLQSAFSSNKFDSTTETVKDIADRYGAILAFNGDFATFNNGGIIIRNGELFRGNKSTRQLLTIDQNGDFQVFVEPPTDAKSAAARFIEQGVWHTCVFGPLLVENGQPVDMPGKFFIKPDAREPRTAVAQMGPLHYLVIIVDGRQAGGSNGVSLSKLQELFLLYGVETAFNLDGGGSTTLYFDGKVINNPANGYARRVPDIFFIGR